MLRYLIWLTCLLSCGAGTGRFAVDDVGSISFLTDLSASPNTMQQNPENEPPPQHHKLHPRQQQRQQQQQQQNEQQQRTDLPSVLNADGSAFSSPTTFAAKSTTMLTATSPGITLVELSTRSHVASTVHHDSYKYFKFNNIATVKHLTITVTACAGNPDVYVVKDTTNSRLPHKSWFSWFSAARDPAAVETIVIAPGESGVYFIAVTSAVESSTFNIDVKSAPLIHKISDGYGGDDRSCSLWSDEEFLSRANVQLYDINEDATAMTLSWSFPLPDHAGLHAFDCSYDVYVKHNQDHHELDHMHTQCGASLNGQLYRRGITSNATTIEHLQPSEKVTVTVIAISKKKLQR